MAARDRKAKKLWVPDVCEAPYCEEEVVSHIMFQDGIQAPVCKEHEKFLVDSLFELNEILFELEEVS